MKTMHGWTLLEALFVTAIVAILTTIGIPSLSSWTQKNEDLTSLQTFQHLVTFARNAAITRAQIVTLCPSADGYACTDDWSQPILIFSDVDHNEVIDPDDRLLHSSQLPTKQCVEWRGSAHKNYLQFKPSGATNGIAGHFRFCEGTENGIDYKVVVALTGRTSQRKL